MRVPVDPREVPHLVTGVGEPTDRPSGAPRIAGRRTRFELAPPRRFLLPAILLLLSEQQSYGYILVKDLQAMRFGNVDGPSVYRALAQLESDGLVDGWDEAGASGHARRVYALTEHGERILRAWMAVIKDERDHLDAVLRRYQATGTVDSVLAGVEGGWGALLPMHSSVLPLSPRPGRMEPRPAAVRKVTRSRRSGVPATITRTRFGLIPDRSVILIEVRSNVGPISFGAIGLTGWVEAGVRDGAIAAEPAPSAHLELRVDELRSGNALYDAELLRRIDARRHQTATIDLLRCSAAGDGHFQLAGNLTFHGVTHAVDGTVVVTMPSADTLEATGRQAFDIRDYAVPSPTVLLLRIFPDVQVQLHVEAEREPT
jgi:DNA-binding PadR family transcriptional regulator